MNLRVIHQSINKNLTLFCLLLGIIVAFESVIFLFRLLLGMWRLSKLKNKYEKINFQRLTFYKTDLEEAPFSYFKFILEE